MTDDRPSSSRASRWLVVVAVLIGCMVILATYKDYGVTWDDSVHAEYGERVVEYFRSGRCDRSANEYLNLRDYGPLFDSLAALCYGSFPGDKYEIRHLLTALLALVTVLGVVRIGRDMGMPWTGGLAAVSLALIPRFYGHAFLNSKDIPFACLMTWSVWALLRFVQRASWKSSVVCGLLFGGALALRPGGLLMLMALFVAVVAFAAVSGRVIPTARKAWLLWVIAWLAMVAVWPHAHESPFLNPLRAIATAIAFPFHYDVLFEGQVIRSDMLPRTYLMKFLWITTPWPVLGLSAIGLAFGLRHQFLSCTSPRALALLAVEVWLFLPFLMAYIGHPNVYDGLRHVLFVLPALALFAGLGAARLLGLSGRWRPGMALLLIALLGSPIRDLVKLHPYQMTYFNPSVGGLEGASGDYETDYWATSYREAARWVNAQAMHHDGQRLKILVAANGYSRDCARHDLAPAIEMDITLERGLSGSLPDGYDYYVATTRYGLDRNFPDAPVVHQVQRDGAAFAIIRGRGPPPGSPDGSRATGPGE